MKESAPVVYASFSEVIATSPLASQEADRLSAVKRVLDAGAQGAEKKYAALPEEKAQRARQADGQLLSAQWVAEQHGARAVVLAGVRKAAEALLTKNGYAVIVDRDLILTGAPDRDVTAALAESLRDVKVDFGALPEVRPVEAGTR